MNGQFKHVFGVADKIQAKTFFSSVSELFGAYNHFEITPILISIFTLALYLLLIKKLPALPNFALCLTISTLVSYILSNSIPGYTIETFSKLQLENFSPTLPDFNFEHISLLFGLAFAIAFLSLSREYSHGQITR